MSFEGTKTNSGSDVSDVRILNFRDRRDIFEKASSSRHERHKARSQVFINKLP